MWILAALIVGTVLVTRGGPRRRAVHEDRRGDRAARHGREAKAAAKHAHADLLRERWAERHEEREERKAEGFVFLENMTAGEFGRAYRENIRVIKSTPGAQKKAGLWTTPKGRGEEPPATLATPARRGNTVTSVETTPQGSKITSTETTRKKFGIRTKEFVMSTGLVYIGNVEDY